MSKFRPFGTLETRAIKNHKSIDGEWISENESREFNLNSHLSSDDLEAQAEEIKRLLDSIDLEDEPQAAKENQETPLEEQSEVDRQIEDLKNNLDKIF